MSDLKASYLTFKDIAKELQVSVRTVSRMVADGLPVVHIRGRIYRVHRDALDQFLQERTRVESSVRIDWLRDSRPVYSKGKVGGLRELLERERQKNKRSRSNKAV